MAETFVGGTPAGAELSKIFSDNYGAQLPDLGAAASGSGGSPALYVPDVAKAFIVDEDEEVGSDQDVERGKQVLNSFAQALGVPSAFGVIGGLGLNMLEKIPVLGSVVKSALGIFGKVFG